MTLDELKEELKNYMGEGAFDAKLINLRPYIRVDWYDNTNNYVQAIDPNLLSEMKYNDICEEVIKPLVMKFKECRRRNQDG